MLSQLNRIAPRQAAHFSKWLLSRGYRQRERELARLKALPRYRATVTTLLGRPLHILDSGSFLFMKGEIFDQQIYAFPSIATSPRIIDGGANIGLSVLFFKQYYPDSRITAFEPDGRVFSVLEKNVQNYACCDIELLQRALWSSETTLEFESEGADGGRLLRAGDAGNNSVRTVRLRNYLSEPIAFLKLDIEGAETEVLIDCADRLESVQNLFVEYHSFVNEPQTVHRILDILAKAGFRVHIHPPVTSPQPFIRRNVHLGMDMQLNIFAFRQSSEG